MVAIEKSSSDRARQTEKDARMRDEGKAEIEELRSEGLRC
jgi:hypothetical protein